MKYFLPNIISLILVSLPLATFGFADEDGILPLYDVPLKDITQPQPHKGAVVITHGWTGEAVAPRGTDLSQPWPLKMAIDICQSPNVSGTVQVFDQAAGAVSLLDPEIQHDQMIRVCQSPNWDVWVVDWYSLAGKCSDLNKLVNRFLSCNQDPDYAFTNAAIIGDIVARYLQKLGYGYIHFIAHSAGSNVIDTAKENILRARLDTELHMTFLDPYDPRSKESEISLYGASAQWVDNYIDTSGLGSFVTGLSDPLNKLIHGFTVDITHAVQSPIGHEQPHIFYRNSASRPDYLYGFPLAKESSDSTEQLAALKPYWTCKLREANGSCIELSPFKPVRLIEESMCVLGTRDCPTSEQGRSGPGNIEFSSGNGTAIRLTTQGTVDSPTAIFLTQHVPDDANYITFDYEFSGTPTAAAFVLFDGKIIRALSNIYSENNKTHHLSVWLGKNALGGPHSLSFFIKSVDQSTSAIQVSNLRFVRKGLSFSPERRDPPTAGIANQLAWTALKGATLYDIEIIDKANRLFSVGLNSEDANCDATGICAWGDDNILVAGSYQWRVRGRNAKFSGPWSDWYTIRIASSVTDSGKAGGGGGIALYLIITLLAAAHLASRQLYWPSRSNPFARPRRCVSALPAENIPSERGEF